MNGSDFKSLTQSEALRSYLAVDASFFFFYQHEKKPSLHLKYNTNMGFTYLRIDNTLYRSVAGTNQAASAPSR